MSSTEAVKGSDSQYISAEPYIGASTIGIMVANSKTTKREQLEMREAELQRWLSSPDQPGYAENGTSNNQLASEVELSWNVSTELPT
ncbi:hypothetical protein VE00_05930 [Pseudogymnoascus sp. WSF 3629]|nr:hypothetical protein VE00_05930 [Pseudogymnoascus sp. WSF 3629]